MTIEEQPPNQLPEEANVEIVTYREEMAPLLAKMYNDWEDLWPGGYTQGVPYTVKRVKDLFGTMSAIAILVAIDKESGMPLGSCTLHQHLRDEDAAYVGTLGVSPEALNRKVGKKLLLRAIEICRRDGRSRVDLNTWPGNMRAVPLYKKVGMMWNATGDGVQMEDYIPGILNHPLTKPFFDSLPDSITWYDAHKREIVQVPDEFIDNEMEIYPYRFENGDDFLSVIVDKHSRSITSVERVLGESRIKVSARVSKHATLCGIPSKYILAVENNTPKDLRINVELKAFDALNFIGPSATKLDVKSGSSSSWEVGFTASSDAPIHRRNLRTPTITAILDIGDEKVHLRTGLVIRPAAEVRTKASDCRIAPGGTTEIPLSILSSADFRLTGTLHVESPTSSLVVKPEESRVSLLKEGISGVVLNIRASPDLPPVTHDLWVYMKLSDPDGASLTTRKFRVPVFCLENGSVALGEDERLRRKTIVTAQYLATFDYEGAILRASNTAASLEGSYLLRSQVGPPFGIDAFRFTPRNVEITEDHVSRIVTMNGVHPERPLFIEDRAIFEQGTGVIIYQVWVTNTGTEPHALQVRVFGAGGGISISPGIKYIPLKNGVVYGRCQNLSLGYPSFPSNPNDFEEGWIALEGNLTVKGQVWDNNTVEEIRIGNNQLLSLSYPSVSILPGERRLMSQVWLMMNASNWREVRQLWLSRVGKRFATEFENETLTAHPSIDFDIKPAIIASAKDVAIEVRARKGIVAPVPIDVEVLPPSGWSASLSTSASPSEKREHSAKIKQHPVQDGEKFWIGLSPGKVVSDGFGIHTGSMKLRINTDMTVPIDIIQLGDKENQVRVDEIEDQGLKGYSVDNGLIQFRVSPEYGGVLYSLKNKHGTEFLMSTFPTAEQKPGSFLNNYYGGIQPVVWDESMDEVFTNAITNKEKMDGKIVEIGPWKGIEISWTGKKQLSTRGAKLKLQYLTAAGSPLLVARWIIQNKSEAPLEAVPTLLVDAALNGTVPEVVFRAEEYGVQTNYYTSQIPPVVMANNNIIWMRETGKRKPSDGLALVHEGTLAGVVGLAFAGNLVWGTFGREGPLPPKGTRTTTSCFMVDPSSDEELRILQRNIEFLIER